ncbi:MAG TPA: hypothetical protein VF780_05755 [Nitrosospira sp.]
MPTITKKVNRKERRTVNIPRLWRLLLEIPANHHTVVCEAPHAFPGPRTGFKKGNGAVQQFSFGYTCGGIHAVVACAGTMRDSSTGAPRFIGQLLVDPTAWKVAMRIPHDKDKVREIAQKLFPFAAHEFQKKQDDGKAEAALLCLYALRKGGISG